MEMKLGWTVEKSKVFEMAQEVERTEGRDARLIVRTISK